jgi:hypothetical protein
MHKIIPILSVFCLMFAGHLAAAPVTPRVNPETMDLGAEVEAKIAKAKAKEGTVSAGEKGGKNGCGNVNINSDDGKKKSSGGGLVGEQKTTVIVGDVINTAKCK